MPTLSYLASLTNNQELLSKRPRILVVDDQALNIQTLYQIFSEDHDVFMATNGPRAIEFCQQTPPDLILLDVIMPGMDGLEVCAELKRDDRTSDIPILFVTAQNDALEESRALTAGGLDFISKPVNPDTVRARVKTHITLKLQRDLLQRLVFTDPLTGLANRRSFDNSYDKEWRHCLRHRHALSMLMIDIDYFKLYNDHYGHQQGDHCLAAVAASLQANFGRPHDVVARYGGEEFICLMPQCELEGARNKAENLCQVLMSMAIPHSESKIGDVVTLSIGVASTVPDETQTRESLIAAADAKLYEAKNAGRNRVAA
ncbi:GGDEF domain-containing response regulator [Undibacterium sp. TJN19]|uniref:GGDEF domain-containing response regulator n=1 Tax=Undibacterium sp. TJN19 TaxID=3413055 RepID=UPI003BF2AA00